MCLILYNKLNYTQFFSGEFHWNKAEPFSCQNVVKMMSMEVPTRTNGRTDGRTDGRMYRLCQWLLFFSQSNPSFLSTFCWWFSVWTLMCKNRSHLRSSEIQQKPCSLEQWQLQGVGRRGHGPPGKMIGWKKCFKVTYWGLPLAWHVSSRFSPSLVKPWGNSTTIFTSGLSETTREKQEKIIWLRRKRHRKGKKIKEPTKSDSSKTHTLCTVQTKNHIMQS